MPDKGPLIRIYWNVNAEGGVCLLQSITSILNRACLPFRLKVVNNPSRFIRCDAAILYLRKADYSDAADTLRSVYREIAGNLSPETPAFTKCIAGGVGLAEDPGQGASFGLHRCRLLANGMIDAHFQGRRSLDDKLALVAARFSEDGLRLEEPFLSAGSSGDFYAPINNDRLNNDRRHKAVNGMARGSEVNFAWPLETADRIGHRLSQQALWYLDCCNWSGDETGPSDSFQALGTAITHRALGPTLYSGSSGVGLFFAELHRATGDHVSRRTALGAIRHSLAGIEELSRAGRAGLHTGWTGVALAAVRIGTVLGEEELLKRTTQLLGNCNFPQDECDADLISGTAGTVVALIILRGVLQNDILLEQAATLGDAVLKSADKSDAGYSWSST